jgi:hypothetical protein
MEDRPSVSGEVEPARNVRATKRKERTGLAQAASAIA